MIQSRLFDNMKTKSVSNETAPVRGPKNFYRKAGSPQTPVVRLHRGLKRLMAIGTAKNGPRIYGWTQFWKDISVPFYGHTRAWWPGYCLLQGLTKNHDGQA
jgi:hypothetical protein